MAQLWWTIWISLPPSVIFWDINFAGKTWSRTSVSVSVSNLVRICSYVAELPPNNWLQNGSFRHLGFLHMQILMAIMILGPCFQLIYQIRCKCAVMVAALNFVRYDRVLRVKVATDVPYSRCLYLIWSKSVQKCWSYCRLNDFKMAAAAMLVSWIVWILTVNLTVGPHFQPMFQIRCKCVQ